MDGMQALGKLPGDSHTADIPVVSMTAKVLPCEIGSYLDAGAEGVAAKRVARSEAWTR
jgi:CheY-like chemotaxis protein